MTGGKKVLRSLTVSGKAEQIAAFFIGQSPHKYGSAKHIIRHEHTHTYRPHFSNEIQVGINLSFPTVTELEIIFLGGGDWWWCFASCHPQTCFVSFLCPLLSSLVPWSPWRTAPALYSPIWTGGEAGQTPLRARCPHKDRSLVMPGKMTKKYSSCFSQDIVLLSSVDPQLSAHLLIIMAEILTPVLIISRWTQT